MERRRRRHKQVCLVLPNDAKSTFMQYQSSNRHRNHQGIVREHLSLPGNYRKLRIDAPGLAQSAQAGQFIHVLTRHNSTTAPLLRRAFSIMSAQQGEIELLYRVVGRGTVMMSEWNVEQRVDLLGPLGQPFPRPDRPVILIGGGVGVPPMLMLAAQTRHESPDLPITALIGARTAREVLGKMELEKLGATVHIATDDGSVGIKGFVTSIFQKLLNNENLRGSIYACGPLGMLRGVAGICAEHGQRALLSLEENMPCGIGVCNGCALPVISDAGAYHQYSRICVEGPGLWSDQIDWEKLQS